MSRRGVKAALGAPEVTPEYVGSKNKKHGRKYKKAKTPESSESSSHKSASRSRGGKGRRSKSTSGSSSSDLDASIQRESPVPYNEPLASQGDVKKVEFLKPLSERVQWSQASFVLSLDGSLNNLKSQANENGQVALIIGHGITPESMSTNLAEQIQSKLSLHSKSTLLSTPSKATTPVHFVRDVVIEGSHNAYPTGTHYEIPNIKGSKGSVSYLDSAGKPVDHLTFTLMPGESRTEKTIMDNKCDMEMINVYSDYPNYTADNLRQDLKEAPTKNGVDRWSVPHTEKSRHPVVDIAAAKMVSEKHLTSKQRREFKRSGNLPAELLETSKDDPSRTFIAKSLFNIYEPRVQKGMSASAPLSDVAHPYAFVSRTGGAQVGYADAPSSKSKLDMVGSKADLWTNPREVHVGRTSDESKKNAFSTDYKSWVRIRVRFADSADIHQRIDKN